MITAYGIIDSEGNHRDTSKTLLAAKQCATRNGYNKVSARTGYVAYVVSVKLSKGKWVDKGSKIHLDRKVNTSLTPTND
jgi:Tfp pilus tip-associated adhesin PilY1